MDISGASALVTGGASGLGGAISRLLAELGAKVTVVDLQDEKGEAMAAEIGGKYAHADVTNTEEVEAAVATANADGDLRMVANCAGIGWAQRTVGKGGEPHDLAVFEKVVQVNVIGTFNVIRLAASAMSQNDPLGEDGERGAMVNIASVAAFDGQTGQASYSAAKGGIVGMTLPIARDLAAVGIRVCTIAPGTIDTPMFAFASEDTKAGLGAGVLFPKRMGRPEEVASLAAEIFRNSYFNAETIRLDGGIRMPPK
ncbi:MAG TPA: SDR family NAD(P)-dependent oxidoreductase [Acidimicrobiales bacterium]|nr:SDR family NAD(P)-dependent oxidoreductase [Acidimicrobiales bacterium]